MKAITFQSVGQLALEHVPNPKIIESTDVIVQVHTCAVCGSDLHVYHGRETGIDQHTVMGHEFAGTVVDVGSDVSGLQIGDQVMSPFTTSCGECFYCRHGLSCRCTRGHLFGWVSGGSGLHGGQAEFVRVPLAGSSLMKVPDGVTMELAVMLGDIIPTGFHCAQQGIRLSAQRPSTVCVVGCGPVGLMAVLGALQSGLEQVFAFDPVAPRAALAAELGARVISSFEDDGRRMINDLTEGRGFDVMLEAVGSRESLQFCYDWVRPGGVISAVGVCTESALPFSPAQAYDKNITYTTGRCPARSLMPSLVPIVQEKPEMFTKIISHRLNLTDGIDAYRRFAAREPGMMKVMLAI